MKKTENFTKVCGIITIPVSILVSDNDESVFAAENILNNMNVQEMNIDIVTIDDKNIYVKCDGWDIEWLQQ